MSGCQPNIYISVMSSHYIDIVFFFKFGGDAGTNHTKDQKTDTRGYLENKKNVK